MDYHKAYIKLYGAAGKALDELKKARIISPELDIAATILQQAIDAAENMGDEKPDGE
jgi:hypothetical protein